MSTYLEFLSDLNRQDFLGGLVKVGESIKQAKQEQRLSELWQEFKVKKEGLMTTDNQVQGLAQEYAKLKQGDETQMPSVYDYANSLITHISRLEALTNVYQPFIQAFSVLGDEGLQISQNLAKELATLTAIEERKAAVHREVLDYYNKSLSTKMNALQFDILWQENETRKKSWEVANSFLEHPLFANLVGVQIDTDNPETLSQYGKMYDTIIKDIMQKYPGLDANTISIGYKLAMGITGNPLRFVERSNIGGGQSADGLPVNFIVNEGMGKLQRLSAWYKNASQDMKDQLQEYINNPQMEVKPHVREFIDAFKPDGEYMTTYASLLPLARDLFKKTPKQIGYSTIEMPEVSDIYIPKSSMSFIKNDFIWDPIILDSLEQSKSQEWEDRLSNQTLFNIVQEASKDNTNVNTGNMIKEIIRQSRLMKQK